VNAGLYPTVLYWSLPDKVIRWYERVVVINTTYIVGLFTTIPRDGNGDLFYSRNPSYPDISDCSRMLLLKLQGDKQEENKSMVLLYFLP